MRILSDLWAFAFLPAAVAFVYRRSGLPLIMDATASGLDWCVFDVEIARDLEPTCLGRDEKERRGEAFRRMMLGEGGMSSAVTWDSRTKEYEFFDESTVCELADYLESFPVVAVFNKNFDVKVVESLAKRNLNLPCIVDPMDFVPRAADGRFQKGKRLAYLAEWNLGRTKSGSGKDAYHLYESGQIAKLFRYNRDDVAILRDLVRHVIANRSMLGPNGLIDLSDLPPWIWRLN